MKSTHESLDNSRPRRDYNLHIIFSVTLMAIMGVASITPALPKITKEFHISPQDIGLLITVFTLPGVFFNLILGILADRFGRKRVLVPSLFLFALSGGACALVQDFHLLLIFRFLQGTGAAALPSINATLIGDLYTGQKRETVMGYNTSVLSLGVAGYPALGGLLTAIGWQYPFLLPLLALPVGFFVLFMLDSPKPQNQQQLAGYLRGVWKIIYNREAAGVVLLGLSTFIILYGSYLTYFPFLLSHRFQASAPLIGLVMSCMSITMALTSSQLGRLTQRYTKKTLIRAAFILYTLALPLIPLMPTLGLLLLPIILLGIGHGINVPCTQILRVQLAPVEYRAAFMAVNGMVLRLGQTLGPLLMGLIFTFWGTVGVFYVGAIFAFCMLIPIMLLLT